MGAWERQQGKLRVEKCRWQRKGRLCAGPCEQRALDAPGVCVPIVPLTCCWFTPATPETKHEIDKLVSSQRLDMNLEKG